MRPLLFLALILFASVAGAQVPIKDGGIVTLLADSSFGGPGWLAAAKDGRVYVGRPGENRAEQQWQIFFRINPDGEHVADLYSYYGTQIMQPTPGVLAAGKYLLEQSQLTVAYARAFASPNGSNFKPTAALNAGDRVAITINWAVPLYVARNPDNSVSWKTPASDAMTVPDLVSKNTGFIVVPIAPAPGRASIQPGLANRFNYSLKAKSSGKGIIFYWPENATDPHGIQNSNEGSPGQLLTISTVQTSNQIPPNWLTWGSTINLMVRTDSARLLMRQDQPDPKAYPRAQLGHPLSGAGALQSQWKIVDPSGQYADGTPLSRDSQFCLQNLSVPRMLSADPGVPEIVLSPNGCGPSGTWEHFTFNP